eukprot:212096-Chlamydomonas_euryale.AAC.1
MPCALGRAYIGCLHAERADMRTAVDTPADQTRTADVGLPTGVATLIATAVGIVCCSVLEAGAASDRSQFSHHCSEAHRRSFIPLTSHYSVPRKQIVLAWLLAEHTLRDMRAYMKQSSLIEYDYWVHPEWVDGAVPKELQGTYLRNGSGMQASGRHPFDGDGQ